jgi:tetratricopeptide (TPR) repeat protein
MKNVIGILVLLTFFSCQNTERKDEKVISREEELKAAIKKYPDSLMLIGSLVQYYRDEGEFIKALRVTDEAIAKDSTEAAYWEMKATLHIENRDTLAGIEAYQRLVRIEPIPNHLIALGWVYAKSGNPLALQLADDLIAAKQQVEKEALLIKGVYNSVMNNKQQAIRFFDECLEHDPTYMFAYREKAIALYDLGMYTDALSVLKTATTLNNSYEEGYYWMGRCYEKLGRSEEAIRSYEMALLYDKNYVEAEEALKKFQTER